MSTEGSAAMLIVVLLKLVSSLDADEECAEILLQAWYLDNGGTRSAVLRALHLIEELGPALGLHVNLAKCEMFSRRGNTSFPPEVRCSLLPNLYIIGAPIAILLKYYCWGAVNKAQICPSHGFLDLSHSFYWPGTAS